MSVVKSSAIQSAPVGSVTTKSEDGRPIVRVGDCEGNAFKLLVRVRAALAMTGAPKYTVAKFNAEANAKRIISTPTHKTPQFYYDHVLAIAAKYCTLDCRSADEQIIHQ